MNQRTKARSSEAASISRLSNRFSSEHKRIKSSAEFYSTLALSSTADFAISTRHSVTSRIHRNSRAFCSLTFSTRHLNATLENRETVEKFTTSPSLFRRFPPRWSPCPAGRRGPASRCGPASRRGRPLVRHASRTVVDKLKSCEYRDHRNHQFKLSRRHPSSHHAAKQHARHAPRENPQKHGVIDRAELPVKCAAAHSQHTPEQNVGAYYFGRRHLRVIQQQHGAECASTCGRKSRFDADRQRQHGQPARIFLGECAILHARNKRNARRSREQHSQQNHDSRAACLPAHEAQDISADRKARHRAEEKEPKISRVDVFADQVERRSDQAQNARENECRAHRGSSGQTEHEDKSGNGKAAAANARQPDR